GGGKGITLANMVRFRAEADPNYLAFWIDPKNKADETGYFAHPQIVCYRFDAAACTGSEVALHMIRALGMFKTMCSNMPDKTPMQLILDEWFFVQTVLSGGDKSDKSALNQVKNTLVGAVSLLDGDRKHILLVSQSPKVDDVLQGSGGILTNFDTIAIFTADNRGLKVLEKCGQCGVVPRELADENLMVATAGRSLRGRALFFCNELHPAPELTNYSNYDRDSGEVIGDKVPQIEDLATIDDGSPVSTCRTKGAIVPFKAAAEPEETPTPKVVDAPVSLSQEWGDEVLEGTGKTAAEVIAYVIKKLDENDGPVEDKPLKFLLRGYRSDYRKCLEPHLNKLADLLAKYHANSFTVLPLIEGEERIFSYYPRRGK
ncbi:MAG: hypothetical protein F6K19_13235, partial [Cyanothece sp. SIO1E1]|nr:hypothetical protein [Cyanothece sp. SIO1E1]